MRVSAVFAAVLAGVVLTFASAASAAGPTTLSASAWQVYSNTNIYGNPDPAQVHGDPGEYGAAPAIPGQSDSGWANCGPTAPFRSSPYQAAHSLCPNPSTIGMGVGSILSDCWNHLNFTFFQSLVSIPEGTTISSFSVNMSGADDGARISIVNSAHPSGFTPSNGYIGQAQGQATGNLAPYVVAGEVNRVVITQVDDCAVGNNLNVAQVLLNGTVVTPDTSAPTDAPAVSPAANGFGWNNSDVSIAWHWTDGGSNASGIDANNCTQSSASTGEGTQTLSATCKDLAGNSRTDSRTVKVDETAPADAPTSSVSGNTVSVVWNWTDGLSGIDTSQCTQSNSNSGNGLVTVSSTCYDRAGNSSSDSVQVQVDNDPPVDSPSAVPAWSNSDVTVDWNWSDAGSGIDPSNCTQSSTSSGEGAVTLTSTCSDLAGNSASDSVTVHVDKTAPSASPVAPTGWQNTDATVAWNWTDGGSGIDAAHCTQSSTSTGEGTITLTSTCFDLAGNSASATATVQVDKTAPVVAYTGGGTYTVDQNVTVTCSSSDALSGVASDTCAGVSGPAWSLGLGTHTLSATATDNAGNTNSGSTTYTVRVDATSLCALVTRWAKNAGLANSLCVKLNAAAAAAARGQTKTKQNNIDAFDNEVSAQSGKGFTAAQAALLVQFAAAL